MNTTNKMIDGLFDNLDKWRHLPSYQLERRADLFFSLYLPEFISKEFNCKIDNKIIPEFPVKLSIIYQNKKVLDETFKPDKVNMESNQSIKIDYVLLTETLDTAYLIELKTDSNSINQIQAENLLYTGDSFTELLSGILDIYCKANISTKNRKKYNCLLYNLDDMGLLDKKNAFKNAYKNNDDTSKLIHIVNNIKPVPVKKIEKIYIAPSKSNLALLNIYRFKLINFEHYAEYINKNNEDHLTGRFYRSLKEWDKNEAGVMK